jgi:hypothetical protein
MRNKITDFKKVNKPQIKQIIIYGIQASDNCKPKQLLCLKP